jgi:peptidoglycan/LPS O-acetylase OafA/YrhL
VKSERSEVIDLFKAVGCVLIVLHHLALYSPMSDVVAVGLPRLEDFLFEHGLLAVQLFLVVGGYLNAKSWVRALSHAEFKVLPRLFARYQRLVIPLLAALTFTVLVTAVVRPYFDHSSLSSPPTWMQVAAHVLLLQDIVHTEAFSAGVWYVAIDFQLFAMALAFAAVAHFWQSQSGTGSVIRKALGFWMLLTLCSMFDWNLNPLSEIWGTYFFFAYGLGLCIGCWRESGIGISYRTLGILMILLGGVAMLLHPRIRLAVALLIASLLCLYESTGCRPISILKQKWIGAVANASYPIFLIHFGVCLLVSAFVFNLDSDDFLINSVGVVVAVGMAMGAGLCLHQLVESVPFNWRRVAQWAAGFAAACAAVMCFT